MKTIILMLLIAASCYSHACLENKLCCRKNLGQTECLTKCANELCPIDFPIEVRL